jgi:adenine-specific DNA-methyltransferase
MANFFDTLVGVLKADERFFTEDGALLRNKVYESALNMDEGLLGLLLGNDETKKRFFADVNGTLVFDKVGFGWVIGNRQFLPDSYTRFKNRIGLTDARGDLISASGDVVLSFPYKDCVLAGGQTKDDQKRDEVFYNATLAPDEVDRLLYPKAFVGAKRYTANGVEENVTFDDSDNLIIKGNNLLAISSLLKRYEGKVKCVCIDPPYNKGTDEFGYNDNFNHSTWLVFMKTRLEVAKRLLCQSSTIFIFCDDVEQAYLRVLADEIFSRESFIQTIVWKNCDNSNNDAKQFSQDHNYILVYSNNPKWESLKLDRTAEQAKHYRNPDNDPRGPWFDGNPVNSPNPRPNLTYTITAPNRNVINPPANGWRWDKKELQHRMETGEIRFNSDNTNIIRRTYLNEQGGLPPSSLWDICEDFLWTDIEVTGHTRQAKYEQKKLYPGITTSDLFKTPKPEKVIEKILRIATFEGDIVIDFFGGSGTTGAVAHKMNRQYILCEQMDYIETFIVARMKKVIDGEQGGVSKSVNWQGGGSFVYCELAKSNQHFVDEAVSAKTDADLTALLERVLSTGFSSSKVNPSAIAGAAAGFESLCIDDKKRFVLELLDKNMLYVNLCDLDDEEYAISDADKAFTRSFYGMEVAAHE